jgi:hypothetical protein
LLIHAGPRLLTALSVAIGIILAVSFAMSVTAQPRVRQSTSPTSSPTARSVDTVAGMPPVLNASNVYSETRPDHLSPVVASALPRVYVPT